MKREIKFKVWDNVDYMSQPFTLQDLQEGKVRFTPECKVMQFTGLKDKNGIDIYEGDRVKILYTDWISKSENDRRTLEEYLESISFEGVVVFQQNGWYLEMWSEKFQEEYLSAIECGTHGFIKVIGNIHEPINH